MPPAGTPDDKEQAGRSLRVAMFGPVLGDRPGFVGFGAGRYQLLAQHFVLSVHPASPGRVSAGVGKLSRAQLALSLKETTRSRDGASLAWPVRRSRHGLRLPEDHLRGGGGG